MAKKNRSNSPSRQSGATKSVSTLAQQLLPFSPPSQHLFRPFRSSSLTLSLQKPDPPTPSTQPTIYYLDPSLILNDATAPPSPSTSAALAAGNPDILSLSAGKSQPTLRMSGILRESQMLELLRCCHCYSSVTGALLPLMRRCHLVPSCLWYCAATCYSAVTATLLPLLLCCHAPSAAAYYSATATFLLLQLPSLCCQLP